MSRSCFSCGLINRRTKILSMILCLSASLVACSSSEDPVNMSESSEEVSLWQTFGTQQATEYIGQCRADYELAESLFAELAEGQVAAESILDEFNQMEIVLDRLASRASLFRNVHPSPVVREAADLCQQNVYALFSRIGLSRPLYDQLDKIEVGELGPIDQRYLEKMREDFELAGVSQDEATRDRITQLNEEMVKISQAFNRNIREDVRSIEVAADRLEGLPQDYIDAHTPNSEGMVVITTNYPDYLPVMQYAEDDDLRLELYQQFRLRGYPDNKEVLENLLAKRYELANLVGFDNYAQYVTSDKMIGSADNAAEFIDRINEIAKPRAAADYDVLLQRLRQNDPDADVVGDWQKTYLEELIKNEVYQLDSQEIRQYFSYDKVRDGIFGLVEDMFAVEIEPWETEAWHSSVETWQIVDDGELVGQFYLDMHPRDGKYNHAAQFGVREGVQGLQTPIAALVCNFPGGDDSAGLMEHSQVETFLHEFGHLLHTLFGGHQPRLSLSGVNTERDFVEAPSQMLEEWVWDAETLKTFATDKSDEVIPDALIEKMRSARDFGRGLWTRHQMYYAALSLNYYNRPPTEVDLDEMMVALQAEYSPFPYVDGTHFYTSFGHLDGYSAIYYTYMWSLVIATDMFSRFEEEGLRNPEVAQSYRENVLAPGGSKDAAELVADFLGRPYNFEAFENLLNASE
jgi:thimet oligopeptidase